MLARNADIKTLESKWVEKFTETCAEYELQTPKSNGKYLQNF